MVVIKYVTHAIIVVRNAQEHFKLNARFVQMRPLHLEMIQYVI